VRVGLQILAVLAGSGCRLHFEEQANDAGADGSVDVAAVSHDEDGDGLPDSADPCPHVAGDATDTDGDGVGDACDVHPSTPTERWRLFSPLTPGTNPFDQPLSQNADSLQVSGDSAFFSLAETLQTVRIDLGFQINALFGTGQHQIAFGLDTGATPYYFIELNENTSVKDFNLAKLDMSMYTSVGEAPTAGMHPGTGFIRLDADATSQVWTGYGGWIGELYNIMGSTPGYTGAPLVKFAINGLDVDLRYIAVIDTVP
jgi:hypothetical protein